MNISELLNPSDPQGSGNPGSSGNPGPGGPNPGGPISETIAAKAQVSGQDDNHNEYPDSRYVTTHLTNEQVADGLARKREELLVYRASIGNHKESVSLYDLGIKLRKGGTFGKERHIYQDTFDKLNITINSKTRVSNTFLQKIRDLKS